VQDRGIEVIDSMVGADSAINWLLRQPPRGGSSAIPASVSAFSLDDLHMSQL
jgi:hypothetical protein